MASNSFGRVFRMTTWGESHGKAIGVVVDGCPAGLPLAEEEINDALAARQPGRNAFVSPRCEPDRVELLSGIFEGKTTGAPISLIIFNKDADSSKYEPMRELLRPGHANFTYLEKYGIFDFRGGGRASARETAARVAAGAIAKKFIVHQGVQLLSYLHAVGPVSLPEGFSLAFDELARKRDASPIFCPDAFSEEKMIGEIDAVKREGDSLGGIVETVAFHLPTGLGDPVYEKIEALLAYAMLSLPATKGFEIGAGFDAAGMRGSQHNDAFILNSAGAVVTETNYAGGVLGGITTGMPLIFRVAFKPTSSINKAQATLHAQRKSTEVLKLPEGSRHDPCVAIRAVPVVEAMAALVLADAFLMNRLARMYL